MAQIIPVNWWGWAWWGWSWDMLKSVYDPNNVNANAFDYNNFTNTPDLSGYVDWPASSTDWDVVLFNWATWKLIKDSWVNLSSKLDASALSNNNYWWAWSWDTTHTPTKNALYDKIHTMDVEIWNKAADTAVVKLTWNQTINWTKTFWTSPVVPSKTTAATNTWTAIATEAQVKLVADDVATINWKIPSAATSSNQLADKNYVDDSINSVTAYYITKNAQGDQWATRAELFAATTFYSGGVVRVPTKNDYTIVLADENHDNATTRYIYNSGWEYQYTVNETALTQAQLDALNSWITSGKVSTYDGYATTISWKQDALTLPATPTQWNLVTWWANNKTLVDWWAIPTWFTASAWGTKVFDYPTTSVEDIVTWCNGWWTAILMKSDWPYVVSKVGTTYITSVRDSSWDWWAFGTWSVNVDMLTYDNTYALTGSNNVVTYNHFNPWWTATTGYVVTKTASWYEWQAPSGWDVKVSSQTGNILTSWMKIWAWTEADYWNLGSYDQNTVYLTI